MLLAPALALVDVACEIVQPYLMSGIVDKGIKLKSLPLILHTGYFMIGLSILAIGANIGNIYFSSHASVGFAAELRKGLFRKIQKLSLDSLDKFSSASLVTRITNDVNILQEVIMMGLRLLIRAPLMLLFAVVIAVSIDASLAVVIAVAIPVLSVAIFFILKRGFPFFARMQTTLDKVNQVVQENLLNIRVVKSFVREDYESSKFVLSNAALKDMSVKASGMVVLILPVMQLVMNLSIVAIVWFGGNKMIEGRLQVGQLMSFITYITQILMSLMMLSMVIMTFSRARASSDRLLEILDTTDEFNAEPDLKAATRELGAGKLEFRNVYFRYQTSDNGYVLNDISFQLFPGQTAALVGVTGSGKSALAELIPRIYGVSKGSILIDDNDITTLPLKTLRKCVNLVVQKNQLFSGTIRENIKWGNPDATDDAVMTAAEDAQAKEFILSLPVGFDTVLGQGGVNLSGGQKQRICLARAILAQPKVLILDDSTSAVDTATDERIRASLKRHLPHTTMLIISQRMTSFKNAGKIMVLDHGAIVASGTHPELMISSAVYRSICHSQELNSIPA